MVLEADDEKEEEMKNAHFNRHAQETDSFFWCTVIDHINALR